MFNKKKSLICAVPYIMPSLDVEEKAIVGDEKDEAVVEQGAEDLLKNLRLEEMEREAFEKGFEEGQRAGFEMGEQKAILLIQRLEKIIADFAELRFRELRELEKQVLQLSLSLAKRIILREISLNPDILADIVKEALMRIQRTGKIVIKIHPSLNEIFMNNRASIMNISSEIVFELDTKAPIYGAEIIGPEEIIITDVEEQLRIIFDEIGAKVAHD